MRSGLAPTWEPPIASPSSSDINIDYGAVLQHAQVVFDAVGVTRGHSDRAAIERRSSGDRAAIERRSSGYRSHPRYSGGAVAPDRHERRTREQHDQGHDHAAMPEQGPDVAVGDCEEEHQSGDGQDRGSALLME